MDVGGPVRVGARAAPAAAGGGGGPWPWAPVTGVAIAALLAGAWSIQRVRLRAASP
jgi:hypothetical protein